VIPVASVGGENDDGLMPSGSGLSMQEVNQLINISSQHKTKHAQR